jgi:phenylpropionate dioxygenase-like ring-hydroxylating dioxygenase large terminal subunit
VNEIGKYFTGSLLGEPYIVVRDDKNEIRAYYNVCRHHAAKVMDVCEENDTFFILFYQII